MGVGICGFTAPGICGSTGTSWGVSFLPARCRGCVSLRVKIAVHGDAGNQDAGFFVFLTEDASII